MKRYLQTLAFFIVVATALPFVIGTALGIDESSIVSTEPEKMTENSLEHSNSNASTVKDRFTVLVTKTGETVSLSLEELTARVLYAEMPASFELEALKSQAVAIRSFILYAAEHPQDDDRHPNADICTDHTHCVAYRTYEDAVEAYGVITADDTYSVMVDAVEATEGVYITYDSEPINAVFHGASYGNTESCLNIWGADVPYLQSVPTPESASEFEERRAFLPSELQTLLESLEIEFTYNPSNWIETITKNSSGRVDTVDICGSIVSAKQLRSLLSLRSTNFTVEFTCGYFVFTTVGYGHGVGLSQYGAELLAQDGADYLEILAHYYPNTTINS